VEDIEQFIYLSIYLSIAEQTYFVILNLFQNLLDPETSSGWRYFTLRLIKLKSIDILQYSFQIEIVTP